MWLCRHNAAFLCSSAAISAICLLLSMAQGVQMSVSLWLLLLGTCSHFYPQMFVSCCLGAVVWLPSLYAAAATVFYISYLAVCRCLLPGRPHFRRRLPYNSPPATDLFLQGCIQQSGGEVIHIPSCCLPLVASRGTRARGKALLKIACHYGCSLAVPPPGCC